jgi:hypothetical protein
MAAALYADTDSIKALLDHGANPNRTNKSGATVLMWAMPDLDKVKLLVERGADLNARSDAGSTPLLVAAGYPGSLDVLRYLISKGAAVHAKTKNGVGALGRAVLSADVGVARFLVESGCSPDEASSGTTGLALFWRRYAAAQEYLVPKLGKPDEHAIRILPASNETRLLERLINMGWNVNAKVSGRTPLLNAVAAEQSSPAVIKLLLEYGADPNLADDEGERPLDWAMYRADPARIDLLKQYGATRGNGPRQTTYPPPKGINDARQSLLGSAALLLSASEAVQFQQRGCVSCHNHSMPAMVAAVARKKGIAVDEVLEHKNLNQILAVFRPAGDAAMQGARPAGEAITIGYTMMALHAAGERLNNTTAAFTHLLSRQQMDDGSWLGNGISRPPIEDSTLTHTALAVRAITLYPIPGQAKRLEENLRRARKWLIAAKARTTEERTMRLMGLVWSKAARSDINGAVSEVLKQQQPEGGWSQLPQLEPDAYATGSSLYALRQAGMQPIAEPYRRGIRFLLRTQYRDGAWLVKTRSFPSQRYFESGYPFGRHQWVSAQGSGWASLAIAETLKDAAETPR